MRCFYRFSVCASVCVLDILRVVSLETEARQTIAVQQARQFISVFSFVLLLPP
jgi:hypothetical protein